MGCRASAQVWMQKSAAKWEDCSSLCTRACLRRAPRARCQRSRGRDRGWICAGRWAMRSDTTARYSSFRGARAELADSSPRARRARCRGAEGTSEGGFVLQKADGKGEKWNRTYLLAPQLRALQLDRILESIYQMQRRILGPLSISRVWIHPSCVKIAACSFKPGRLTYPFVRPTDEELIPLRAGASPNKVPKVGVVNDLDLDVWRMEADGPEDEQFGRRIAHSLQGVGAYYVLMGEQSVSTRPPFVAQAISPPSACLTVLSHQDRIGDDSFHPRDTLTTSNFQEIDDAIEHFHDLGMSCGLAAVVSISAHARDKVDNGVKHFNGLDCNWLANSLSGYLTRNLAGPRPRARLARALGWETYAKTIGVPAYTTARAGTVAGGVSRISSSWRVYKGVQRARGDASRPWQGAVCIMGPRYLHCGTRTRCSALLAEKHAPGRDGLVDGPEHKQHLLCLWPRDEGLAWTILKALEPTWKRLYKSAVPETGRLPPECDNRDFVREERPAIRLRDVSRIDRTWIEPVIEPSMSQRFRRFIRRFDNVRWGG
ncbi:hypothetical protein BJ912DRAFT_927352 [Pholiota molesta]|nr:hypothetical protein BJ912DRAFT_927352 [Pholiota molesta]